MQLLEQYLQLATDLPPDETDRLVATMRGGELRLLRWHGAWRARSCP
ncbi:MAG: hypothetical protein ACRDQ4_14495 [Pseudonocardiaceae bacterium]